MKSVQKYIVAAAMIATLGIGASSVVNNASQNEEQNALAVALLTRKVNEYEGQHKPTGDAQLTRKVNEYEGQHKRAAADMQLTRKVNEYEGQHKHAFTQLTRKVNEYEGQH